MKKESSIMKYKTNILPFLLFLLIFYLPISGLISAEKKTYVRVSSKNPNYFELTDGTPYIPIGVNLCILREKNAQGEIERIRSNTERGLEKMEFYFKKLAENGGNYARIWLSSDFYETEHDKIGVYDPKIMDRIATTLDMAKKYNVRLKFCMEHFRSISTTPSQPFFNKDLYTFDPKKTIRTYVTSDWGQKLYLDRCRAIIERFKDHPNVFAWELWNEVNCIPNCIPWTEKMLPEIHKLAPHHMVMQSLGSFDSKKAYSYYQAIVTMKNNDAAQIHRYLDPGAPLEICRGPMDRLSADMVTTIRKMVKNKPILATEMGAVEWCHAGPSKLYDLDKEGILFHDILFAPFFAGAAGSGHCWHWYHYLELNDLWYHIGRFSRAVQGVNPIMEQFEPFDLDQGELHVYGLRGKTQILLWLRDQKNNWKTELIDKVPAALRKGAELDLSKIENDPKITNGKISIYDPWLDKEISQTVKNGKLRLPNFRRSLVVKILF